MGQVAKRIEDKRLRKLIRAFLNAGVMENGLVSSSVEGTPQGGPKLLSNVVLDELESDAATVTCATPMIAISTCAASGRVNG